MGTFSEEPGSGLLVLSHYLLRMQSPEDKHKAADWL